MAASSEIDGPPPHFDQRNKTVRLIVNPSRIGIVKSIIAVACLLLISVAAVAAIADDKPPTDFADIRFGEKGEAVKAKMLAKANVKLVEGLPDGSEMTFEGGEFVGQPVTKWELRFNDDKFVRGRVYLAPEDSSGKSLRKIYGVLKQSIDKKYRKAGMERHQGAYHSATYWNFETRRGKWVIACDVHEQTPGIFLEYSFTAASKGGADGSKALKKDL